MAVLIDHEAVNFTGSRSFETARTAGLIGHVTVRLARCTTLTPTFWPLDSTVLTLSFWASSDGGTTWKLLVGSTSRGGIISGAAAGQTATEATENRDHFDVPANTNRLRVSISTTARIVSQLTVEVD